MNTERFGQVEVTEPLTEPVTEPLTAPIDLDDPRLYVNRELSLLAFQERVLAEAEDASNPLLERVKFLTIVASNLGEFFMVRVGGLKQQIEAGVAESSVGRSDALGAARAHSTPRAGVDGPVARVLRESAASAGCRGHPHRGLPGARRWAEAGGRRVLRRGRVPCADAAGGRPRAAVPPHLEPELEPCRGDRRRPAGRAFRPSSKCRRRCPGW